MSNSLTRFVLKEDFFGKAMLVANTSRAQIGGRNQKSKVKYPVATQKVGSADIYVTEARRAEEVEIGQEVIFGQILAQPQIRSIENDGGSTGGTFTVFTFLATGAKKGGVLDPATFKTSQSDDLIITSRTGGSDISSMIDIEKTFGAFSLIAVEAKTFRDADGESTGEIEKYVIQARSTVNNEVYQIDISDLDTKVKDLPLLAPFRLTGEIKASLFRDQSQVENIRTSISIKAEDVEEIVVETTSKSEPPKAPENKPASTKDKGNQNK